MLFTLCKSNSAIVRTIFVVGFEHLLPSTTITYRTLRINMPKSKTKSRPAAQPDAPRAESPAVATRTRLAIASADTGRS